MFPFWKPQARQAAWLPRGAASTWEGAWWRSLVNWRLLSQHSTKVTTLDHIAGDMSVTAWEAREDV